VEITAPASEAVFRVLRPNIEFTPVSDLGAPVDVQVEWRTSVPTGTELAGWLPTATYTQSLMALSSGVTSFVQPPTDLKQTSWFYRMRAGSIADGKWSFWTDKNRNLDIQPVLGSAAVYSTMNVGVPSRSSLGAVAYSEMNIGAEEYPVQITSAAYADMNFGVVPGWKMVATYSDLNIHPILEVLARAAYADMTVTTDQPSPVIWWIRPEQGKEGYIFNIYGHGFGDFQNQYNGKITLGNLVCQISKWEKVPENSSLDKVIKHGQALDPDEITTEHGWIVAIVPTGAVSAMVKVVLEVL
jgi:hypothetical protein